MPDGEVNTRELTGWLIFIWPSLPLRWLARLE
jgi:hypothetical protein